MTLLVPKELKGEMPCYMAQELGHSRLLCCWFCASWWTVGQGLGTHCLNPNIGQPDQDHGTWGLLDFKLPPSAPPPLQEAQVKGGPAGLSGYHHPIAASHRALLPLAMQSWLCLPGFSDLVGPPWVIIPCWKRLVLTACPAALTRTWGPGRGALCREVGQG